jgi:prepilin-type N-terminal cleavage/methylation domain-containing protein
MSRRLLRALRREDGLTLSEMVVVMAILGIIVAALAMGMSLTITQSAQIQDETTLETESRAVIDQMARELRQAYTGDTTYPIKTATSTTIEFLSPDFATPFHNRRIAYRLTGGHIDRAVTASTNTGAPPWTGWAWSSFAGIPASAWDQRVSSVTSSTLFTYYGTSLDPVTNRPVLLTGTIDPTKIGQVDITVTVTTTTGAHVYTYNTSASLRWQP